MLVLSKGYPMYRFIAILLISALLLTGCAKAETDSYIQVIVPEGGGYDIF